MSRRVRRDENSDKKIWVLIFVMVSAFCLILFAARGRFVPMVTSPAVISVLAPFQRALAWAGNELDFVTATIWEVATCYHQNEMLKNEVVQLRQQNLQAEEYAAENIRLRELLNYKASSTQFDLIAAQVIGRNLDTWTNVIVVNRGTMDGIAKNMPVVTEKGLVGMVTEVTPNAATVQLILDPRSSVGALVQRPESRVAGIVRGNMEEAAVPQMVDVPRNSDIKEGDIIVTSGFGGIFPKGIMIGKVASLKNDTAGLLAIGSLEPAVDFQKLENVMIITASREAPPMPLTPPKQTPGTETNPDGTPVNPPKQ